MMRELTEADVTFTITVEQDCEPVRGNLMDSGESLSPRGVLEVEAEYIRANGCAEEVT